MVTDRTGDLQVILLKLRHALMDAGIEMPDITFPSHRDRELLWLALQRQGMAMHPPSDYRPEWLMQACGMQIKVKRD